MSEEDKTLILWHYQLGLPIEWWSRFGTTWRPFRETESPSRYTGLAFRIPPRE